MKPMLAVNCDGRIDYPAYASPKLDGIRCVIKDGVALSRSLKPIPNKFIQEWVSNNGFLNGLDGELIVGNPCDQNVMQTTTSGVMSRDGTPDFTYHVFDYWSAPSEKWEDRLNDILSAQVHGSLPDRCEVVPQVLVHDEEELLAYEKEVLAQGYEGVMLRSVDGFYKYGRSTLKEGYLLKLKRFADGEAEVIGVEELQHNHNQARVGELGQTVRSSEKAGMVGGNTLGALVVKDLETGVTFNIGTGFTSALREELWAKRESLVGQIVKYKHFPTGVVEAPRFPVFLGFRNRIDM
nr:MAG TPA: adenylation DNA ligase-like protein [Caudoviricetes sp.]